MRAKRRVDSDLAGIDKLRDKGNDYSVERPRRELRARDVSAALLHLGVDRLAVLN